MTQYLISFDDGAMTFPEEELPDVAEAAHAVAQEAKDKLAHRSRPPANARWRSCRLSWPCRPRRKLASASAAPWV